MGKGFQNFMSKKDFHPSAWWNLKKVWEARQLKDLDKKRQDDMRAQYDKEQEILNNKALLGDEKARIGLSFMYDAPAGITKEDKGLTEIEPKFEWQRKYNAPREAWAKDNEMITDQPFGIQVRNVRCVKCHTWGHLNTDRECPLFNMSGNHEDAGISTNPSDLVKEYRQARSAGDGGASAAAATPAEQRDHGKLVSGMEDEYGLTLKKHVLDRVRADAAIDRMGAAKVDKSASSDEPPDENRLMFEFLQTLSEKERAKIFNKFFDSTSGKPNKLKKSKKDKKVKKERKRKSSAAFGSSPPPLSSHKRPRTSPPAAKALPVASTSGAEKARYRNKSPPRAYAQLTTRPADVDRRDRHRRPSPSRRTHRRQPSPSYRRSPRRSRR